MGGKELKYLRLFKGVCKQINASLELPEVLHSITENAAMILGAKGCGIFLLDPKNNRLNLSASYGLSREYIEKGPLDAEKSMADCLSGKTVLVHDAANDPRIQYREEAKREGVGSILSMPMAVRDRVIGVLRIYTATPTEFSEFESEFISGLAEIGAIGIENARMYHHLKGDYEKLVSDVTQWFDFGTMARH